ncbi:MAG: hypothetical protein M3371_01855 [Acidobacteriota bacterium]|nr:hypothetical protein [Acidobacteriota bacterium]
MTDYTFSTILCPGGLEFVLIYLLALSVLPLTIGVGFVVALVKLIREGGE